MKIIIRSIYYSYHRHLSFDHFHFSFLIIGTNATQRSMTIMMEEEDGKTATNHASRTSSLTILSLNMEFYHQYSKLKEPSEKHAYEQYLKAKIASVDIMCLQEDLMSGSDEFLRPTRPFHDFRRIVASFEEQDDYDTRNKHLFLHYDEGFTSTLGNSIYVRKGKLLRESSNSESTDEEETTNNAAWTVTAKSVVQISSESLRLPNNTPLEYRCVVSITLVCSNMDKPVQVLCTHLSGGRFEDRHMDETPFMNRERGRQMQRCLDQKDETAYNVLVGDFNASPTRTLAMDGYFRLLQSEKKNLSMFHFYSYMMAPFTTLAAAAAAAAAASTTIANNHNSNSTCVWQLLYDTLDGPTSRFGHVVDYFVTYPRLPVHAIKRVRMIQQYMEWVTPTADDDFKDESSATALCAQSITDHNGVQVTFFFPPKDATAWDSTFQWGPYYPILQYREDPFEGPVRVNSADQKST